MPYTFDAIYAVDPNNTANIAKNATITIFDPADPAQAPIAIQDPTGSPLPNPITVDAAGMGPAFQHPTLARVGWKGAGFTNYFTSYEGMFNETVAAKTAAQSAASEASNYAANATSLVGTALASTVSTVEAASAAAVKAAALVNAPAGAAIAAAVTGNAEVKAAISEAIHQQTAPLAPLVARSPYGGSPVTNESIWPDGNQSDGVNVFLQTRKRHIALQSAAGIRLVYAHLYNRDLSGTAPITVRAGVDPVTGSPLRVFFNGKRDVVIEPGAYVVSDPVPIDMLAGDAIYTRTLVTVASGGKFPLQGTGLTSPTYKWSNTVAAWGEGSETGSGAYTDKTQSGTIAAIDNGATFAPIAILAQNPKPAPFVAFDGDSIMSGLGDVTGTPPAAGRGFARRALNNTVPYISIAASGQTLADSVLYRDPLIVGALDVICETAINDLRAGNTATMLKAAWVKRWQKHARRGARVWQTTTTPSTTSTDAWATTANQTPFAGEAHRVECNNWLRDGAPLNSSTFAAQAIGASGGTVIRAGHAGHPLTGYFELADTVETARNSGIWKVGHVFTSDNQGVHPSTTGHAAMAAAINPALFTSY